MSRDAGPGPRAAAACTPGRAAAPVSDRFRQGREQAIDSRPLRAAGLVDDRFAEAAGLRLATVEPMEENIDGSAHRSRRRGVGALRRLGIRVSPMEGGIIGVGVA